MITALLRYWHRRHKWKYHNPADRTCTICGRHEIQYCADIRDVFNPFVGWWEAHIEGDLALHDKETK